MAVVFISPRKRQRTFFVVITLMFLLFLVFISLGVLYSKPSVVDSSIVFNSAKINIDMSVFDSARFKNLESPTPMGIQYKYKATTRSKLVEQGFISSVSIAEARKTLEGVGLTVVSLDEATTGRENPFVPYYTVAPKVVVTPPTSSTTTTTSSTSTSTSTTTTSPPPPSI